ncbi:hypothetical protein LTR15_011616 [Elasticomyces elasticus]|nr:hypothetical protein LTR15_011616 [Elasticomyces elasticus]
MVSNSDAILPINKVCGICGTNRGMLFKCGRCKSVMYCSKECQVKHWPLHKDVCKALGKARLDPNFLYGYKALPAGIEKHKARYPVILVSVVEKPSNPTGFGNSFTGATILEMRETTELPITTALGFSLGMARCTHGSVPQLNLAASLLMTDCDIRSPTFAYPAMPRDIPIGGIYLSRRDGKHMPATHVIAMLEYLRTEMDEFFETAEREHRGEKVDRQELVDRFLTPTAFVRGFAKMKREKLEKGETDWEDVDCPVEVDQKPKKIGDTTIKDTTVEG